MQNDPSPFVPRVPPLPGPDPRKRRLNLLPAWLAVTVMLALLAFVLVRNYLHDHRPRAQDTSDLVSKELAAVTETKTAFAQVYAGKPFRAATVSSVEKGSGVDASMPKGNHGSTAKPGVSTPPRSNTRGEHPGWSTRRNAAKGAAGPRSRLNDGDVLADGAVEQWRSITASPASRPGAWRRLGITLFLFNKPGGMAAFRQIPRLPPPTPVPVAKVGIPQRVTARVAVPEAATLPRAEEAALWETLYGPVGPQVKDVPALRAKIARLRLGWFEDIAAAQLYERAGLTAEAGRAVRQARSSADTLTALLTTEFWLQMLGLLLLASAILGWMARLIAQGLGPVAPKAAPGPRPVGDFYSPPAFVPTTAAILESSPPVSTTSVSTVSFRARVIAFVVYFASFLLIAWPLQFLSPLIAHLSDRMALRVTLAIQLVAYIPVMAITLFAFKRIAEAEQRRRMTWRETLSAAGLRSDGFGRDTLTAVVAYTMTMPILLLAGLVSAQLFRNFYTPTHPIDLIILNTQDVPTRVMLLLQATVAAPIVEELTFRGLLFQGLREKWGIGTSATLSAAVFALSHNTLPGGFLVLWTLGFVFALVCNRNRSIVPSMLMHAMHNGRVIVLMFAVFSQ